MQYEFSSPFLSVLNFYQFGRYVLIFPLDIGNEISEKSPSHCWWCGRWIFVSPHASTCKRKEMVQWMWSLCHFHGGLNSPSTQLARPIHLSVIMKSFEHFWTFLVAR